MTLSWASLQLHIQIQTSSKILHLSVSLKLSALFCLLLLSFSPHFTSSIFSVLTLHCLDQMTITCRSFQPEPHEEATEIDERSLKAWRTKAGGRRRKHDQQHLLVTAGIPAHEVWLAVMKPLMSHNSLMGLFHLLTVIYKVSEDFKLKFLSSFDHRKRHWWRVLMKICDDRKVWTDYNSAVWVELLKFYRQNGRKKTLAK